MQSLYKAINAEKLQYPNSLEYGLSAIIEKIRGDKVVSANLEGRNDRDAIPTNIFHVLGVTLTHLVNQDHVTVYYSDESARESAISRINSGFSDKYSEIRLVKVDRIT